MSNADKPDGQLTKLDFVFASDLVPAGERWHTVANFEIPLFDPEPLRESLRALEAIVYRPRTKEELLVIRRKSISGPAWRRNRHISECDAQLELLWRENNMPWDQEAGLGWDYLFKIPPPQDGDELLEFFQQEEMGADDWYLFHLINAELKRRGLRLWRAAEFLRRCKEHDDTEQELWELREAKRKRDLMRAEYQAKSGRPISGLTRTMEKISFTLGVSFNRAYHIAQNGTGRFEHRKKLAEVFKSDPERNYPAAWDLKDGSKWGRKSRASFNAFVTSSATPSATVETLRPIFDRGELPDGFDGLREFIKTCSPLGLDTGALVALWEEFETWRAAQ